MLLDTELANAVIDMDFRVTDSKFPLERNVLGQDLLPDYDWRHYDRCHSLIFSISFHTPPVIKQVEKRAV